MTVSHAEDADAAATGPQEQRHHGQCHCGAVRFSFLARLDRAVRCNCSYCVRKSALHHRVTADRFELSDDRNALRMYHFGTHQARHFFCGVCGIHTHCHPRSAPEQVNVNLHCVPDIEALLPALSVATFDGRSWSPV
ncbi:hypothetical protein ABIC63_002916 [Pseudacidovorax sp. 1753]|uniref:GFA family protein n=1 Tax=Pseudacidovorax sp. 1753 TaxID=3156419 RepID=UPI0033918F31